VWKQAVVVPVRPQHDELLAGKEGRGPVAEFFGHLG
jgi:hypothetical protein